METYLFCHGLTAALPWTHSCSAMDSQLFCHGDTAVLSRRHSCSVTETQAVLVIETQLFCHGDTAVLPWRHGCSAMETRLFCHRDTAVLPWRRSCTAREIRRNNDGILLFCTANIPVFTSYGLAWSTTCGSLSSLQVGGSVDLRQVSHHPLTLGYSYRKGRG